DQYVDQRAISLRLSADDNVANRITATVRNQTGTSNAFIVSAGNNEDIDWQLTSGDGAKTVSVVYEDENGNESDAGTITVTLDTTAPRLTHTPVTTADSSRDLNLEIDVTDTSPITGTLYYREGGERDFSKTNLTGSRTLSGRALASNLDTGIAYYFEVTDAVGHVSRFPSQDGALIGVRVTGTYSQETPSAAQTWALYSVPMTALSRQLSAVFDDGIGSGNWTAQRWNGTTNAPITPVAQLGQAFWFISKTAFRMQSQGTLAAPSEPQKIALQKGWNFVANPYIFPVPFGNVRIDVGDGLRMDDDAATGYVRPRFWEWRDATADDATNGDYVMHTNVSDVWEPWAGYWMFSDADVALLVDPFETLGAAAPSFAPQTPLEWSATIALSGERARSQVTLALARSAEVGYDRLDIEQPPLPGSARVSLLQSEMAFQQIALPSDAREWTWEVQIASSGSSALSLNGSLPAGHRLYVEDLTTGERRELRSTRRIELRETESRRVRFRLTQQRLGWDVADAAPTRTQLLPNYPNPFNPETWVPFLLSEESDVALSIWELSGKRVRRIELGRLAAGRYSDKSRAIYWDGRNDLGESVASGVYIIELQAGSHREMRRLTIAR
ncbi:MAG: hypothetical protein O3A46_16260, partial [Candidatus Poribacteria bacterium]|nr:hypothetical protein [Candidatus Poribacteria bacterium]